MYTTARKETFHGVRKFEKRDRLRNGDLLPTLYNCLEKDGSQRSERDERSARRLSCIRLAHFTT